MGGMWHRPRRVSILAFALGSALAALGVAAPAICERAPLGFTPAEPYRAALLADLESGDVLFAERERMRWPPASMTKMMTALVALEEVRAGRASLADPVRVSAWASRMGGSQVYLAEGETFSLGELLAALLIQSANDAAVAVAEHVAGSTAAFVDRMNRRAHELGLEDTEFHSVHGLPPDRGQAPDLSSARDLARLARALLRHPEARRWVATREAAFRGGAFRMRNTNRLLGRVEGVTGVKTGYFRAAGFGVTATARRGGLELVAVVLGAARRRECFDRAAALLERGFADYRLVAPAREGEAIGPSIRIAGGRIPRVRAVAADDLRLVLPRRRAAGAAVEVRVPAQLAAPIRRGERVGEVVVRRGEETLGRVDLVSPRSVPARPWWETLF